MKYLIIILITASALVSCVNTGRTIKKNRNMEFNCENHFKVTFQESITIISGDSTSKIKVFVKSPSLNGEYDMKQARAASGVKYETKDGKYYFWEHQGEFAFGTEDSVYCLCK
ncbi:MliC family protein [Fluviicola sp.]|jgi:membrane-bound inhibitor of C-type lysozyme|uniref:MliC family protein n=1 Tax=Fluviicola sp. TaxID=1917219 RepID=UPI00282A0B3A|nr:MliC family protein [Fluviicola sp.]MDR0802774.1 MliC family protein [Fluviicola sp.]